MEKEYFELDITKPILTQRDLDEEEKRLHVKYGYGTTFKLLWSEFLIKNNLKLNGYENTNY